MILDRITIADRRTANHSHPQHLCLAGLAVGNTTLS